MLNHAGKRNRENEAPPDRALDLVDV